MQPYQKSLKKISRQLRNNMTDAEQALWYRLKRKQIRGVQFYRQKTLLSFIVDFYCAKANLVIELDGSQHYELDHQQHDQERDRVLAQIGLLVLRFDSRQVLTEFESVMVVIDRVVAERMNPP